MTAAVLIALAYFAFASALCFLWLTYEADAQQYLDAQRDWDDHCATIPTDTSADDFDRREAEVRA